MAIQLLPSEQDIGRIVQALIEVIKGRQNNTGQVTLNTGSATTVVSFQNCSLGSVVMLSPRNANAAAEVGNGTIFISNVGQKTFTITHANNGLSRIFDYEVTGGG